ncbi:hypothetical protein Tco_0629701 [Tanacetum coccineum]|uniref:Uncharacterized protein n=1 Tax=Tanacetum coccineum TaxID=301880 RepID=A0ABQ4WTU7_9ASTR
MARPTLKKIHTSHLISTSHLIPTNSTTTLPSSSTNELIHDCNPINIETHHQTPLPPNAATIVHCKPSTTKRRNITETSASKKPPSGATNFRRQKRGRHQESPSLLPPYLLLYQKDTPTVALTSFSSSWTAVTALQESVV